MKDYLNPDKQNQKTHIKVHDSDSDEDDENFQEDEDKRVYAKYILSLKNI